ncbi:inhibin alpha chain [Polypterus senegalus]|nr:inhibin alpha chain [Polypterus senegalus]
MMWFIATLLLVTVQSPLRANACEDTDLSRNAVIHFFKEEVLDSLGLTEPPIKQPSQREYPGHPAYNRVRRDTKAEERSLQMDTSQVILLPSTDCSCASSEGNGAPKDSRHLTYSFHPSGSTVKQVITSAHFWFFKGKDLVHQQATNGSDVIFIISGDQKPLEAAEKPEWWSEDGWAVYLFNRHIQRQLTRGPFIVDIHCQSCSCHSNPDKIPFLQLQMRPKRSDRFRRSMIPWSPTAIDLLQRPSPDKVSNNCHLTEVNISFQELGWDNWIVHPKSFTFQYCHGNCSTLDQMATILGLKQCCVPVPGTMKSLRFRTTSDGGYSFKYETLPNIIAEECTCL